MKKLFTAVVIQGFSYPRSFTASHPWRSIVSSQSTNVHSTAATEEEKADLHFTELTENERVKRRDAVIRASNKTVLLNATVEWDKNSDQDDFIDKNQTPVVKNRKERRLINFKTNAKKLFKHHPAAEALVASAENIGFSQQLLIRMICENPRLSSFNPVRVISNLAQLIDLGFTQGEIRSMARKYPDLLDYDDHDITDSFETWRKGGLFERFLIELFIEHPLLFSLNDADVLFRLKRLKYLMMGKINRITSALKKNPSIMDGDWDRVEKNFAYLYGTMRVTEKDMSRSGALSLPLSLIKLRHTFLERCGEYIRPKMKETTGFGLRKNPPLSAIVDSSDPVFCVNVAKVSLDEYLVFKKLMQFNESDPEDITFHE